MPILFVARCLNHYMLNRKISMTNLKVTAMCFPYNRNCAVIRELSFHTVRFTLETWLITSGNHRTILCQTGRVKDLKLPHPFQGSKNSGVFILIRLHLTDRLLIFHLWKSKYKKRAAKNHNGLKESPVFNCNLVHLNWPQWVCFCLYRCWVWKMV